MTRIFQISFLLTFFLLPVEASAAERHIAPPAPPLPAPPTPAPPLPQADSVLVAAARIFPGVRFHEGVRDPTLTRLAQQNADQQARRGQQGHYQWQQRYDQIRRQLGMRAVEVSAETWRWQANAPMAEIGVEMFRTWRQSNGPYPLADHWGVVSKPHRRYGDGLAKSRRGIWYAAVIVAD